MACKFLNRIQSHIRERSIVSEDDDVDGMVDDVVDVLQEIESLLSCIDEFAKLCGCTEEFIQILLECVNTGR